MDPPPENHSPRASLDPTIDDLAAPIQPKLRLMCSYGGHIVPRPHDKSLCYVGGDTRIVVVDRQSISLSSVTARMSSTLLGGRPFSLKYQLPNEDMDSLISVTTDEDLENMIEEYDRIAASSFKGLAAASSRLRLFLFPAKPESTQSLIDSGALKRGEDWFFSVLNGGHHLKRGFSDSAASSVNCLLGLDDPNVIGNRDIEGVSSGIGVKKTEIQSVPDSPMMETTSSFGSTSSSPSLVNLPPIKVHPPEDQKILPIEEQFAQVTVAGSKSDENILMISSPPPLPISIVPIGAPSVDYRDRVVSDDERSDQSGLGLRKQNPPQSNPLPPLKSGIPPELPSPDSVSSEITFSNAINKTKLQAQPPRASELVPHAPLSVPESPYLLQPQPQQQFVHAPHYIHHTRPPVAFFYPPPPQQQQQNPGQQYPMYYVPAGNPIPDVGPSAATYRPSHIYQVPSTQQYVAYQPPTSVASGNYGYVDSSSTGQIYYAPQYQTMTNAAVVLPEVPDAPNQLRTSQPI